VSDHAIGDNPAADMHMHAARLGLSTKVVVEPTVAQGLVSACRLRWAAVILDRAARRGEHRATDNPNPSPNPNPNPNPNPDQVSRARY
jgi:hypothetical protein